MGLAAGPIRDRLNARVRADFGVPACLHCPARTSDLCKGVKDEDLDDLFTSSGRVHLKPEETLILDGDDATIVYNVISGTMRLTRLSADGRRQILGFLFSGNYIGLTPDGSYHFNAEAVTEVELCTFDRKRIETLFKLHPAMEANFHRMSARIIDQAHDLVFTLGRRSAVERVAVFLLFLKENEHSPGTAQQPIPVPMTRTDIADFLGLTIETVSRAFTKLKQDNIIRLPDAHSVEVVNMNRLRMMAGVEPV